VRSVPEMPAPMPMGGLIFDCAIVEGLAYWLRRWGQASRCGRDMLGDPMRRDRVVLVLVGAAVAWCAASLPVAALAAGPVAGAGTWRAAIEVPGLAVLNTGGRAAVVSVSCRSAGNCAAGGSYLNSSGQQGFVVGERNGLWGRAIEVPGLAALNVGGFAQVLSVSCASAGNCAAGGLYLYASGHPQGFVVSERNGSWGKAIKMPGRGPGQVNSVSCGSAGNCAAGGLYTDAHARFQGFVVRQR
jgi:hypothetical protein